jgi:hypothetical protein
MSDAQFMELLAGDTTTDDVAMNDSKSVNEQPSLVSTATTPTLADHKTDNVSEPPKSSLEASLTTTTTSSSTSITSVHREAVEAVVEEPIWKLSPIATFWWAEDGIVTEQLRIFSGQRDKKAVYVLASDIVCILYRACGISGDPLRNVNNAVKLYSQSECLTGSVRVADHATPRIVTRHNRKMLSASGLRRFLTHLRKREELTPMRLMYRWFLAVGSELKRLFDMDFGLPQELPY